jgi:PadR family transcriptional regulator, regulatory protein AphA
LVEYVCSDIVHDVLHYVKADIVWFRRFFGRSEVAEKKTLDYVILAGLIRNPRSGYDLTKWMERETSHFFVVGHSSIYPALARMEREGLVRYEVVASERGPKRKVYSITEVGREALLTWAQEPAAEREVRDEQLVKALCYGFLPGETVLERLQEEKERHERKLEMYEGFERGLQAQLREGVISQEAYLGTLLTLRRGIGAEKSYAEWCEEVAEMISSAAPSHSASRSSS